jgi:hypothetical protein
MNVNVWEMVLIVQTDSQTSVQLGAVSTMVQVLWYRYYGTGTLVQVLWYRYYGTGTLVQVQWYRYFGTGTVVQVL